MTPLEKAIQLVAKYKSESFGITTYFQHYKRCALIAVDEILKAHLFNEEENHYWFEVKQEIEKL